jgi:hypothetical protein
MSHRVRYVEISYDQDMDPVDEEVLIALIEDFMCPEYAHLPSVPEHKCPLIGISCRTEHHLCSNCNTNRPCNESESP